MKIFINNAFGFQTMGVLNKVRGYFRRNEWEVREKDVRLALNNYKKLASSAYNELSKLGLNREVKKKKNADKLLYNYTLEVKERIYSNAKGYLEDLEQIRDDWHGPIEKRSKEEKKNLIDVCNEISFLTDNLLYNNIQEDWKSKRK